MYPELYEEMGINPPKGVILYGVPGTGKILLAKAVANQTSATFLCMVGSELIQKYLGDSPKLVHELIWVAEIGEIPEVTRTDGGTHIKQLMRTHLALNGSSIGGIFALQLDIESNCIAFSGHYHAGSIVQVNDTFAMHIREIGIR